MLKFEPRITHVTQTQEMEDDMDIEPDEGPMKIVKNYKRQVRGGKLMIGDSCVSVLCVSVLRGR
jgi:hypothetical protein